MSVIEKMAKIVNDGDVAAGEKLIHDDYQFLMHASGKKLGKQDILKWLGMKDVKKEKVRVLFENDEVGFEHAFASYSDGNKEAVMTYYKFKDGKVAYMETGATKLPK
ncbi:nuclear transport factor 2 family protein [Pelagibacteraceae bacterium]|nr:nuclear transport factor 2 family protein [Pelagibacteraceae bacterium]